MLANILYNLYSLQPNFKFRGNSKYWKGSSANETIKFRTNINSSITNNGFSLVIQREILKWGGIHGFNQYSIVDQCIIDLDNYNQISTSTASAISSYSKLFGFYNPKKYFILDARVCYVYNKLIILHNLSELKPVNFNITRSRNKNLKNNYTELMKSYTGDMVSVKDFYLNYCQIVKTIHVYFLLQRKDVFSNYDFENSDPEIIEMFLFFLADHI